MLTASGIRFLLIILIILVMGFISTFLLSNLSNVAAHPEDSDSLKKIEELSKEEKLYINQCAVCHNWGGTGKGIFLPLVGIGDKRTKEQVFAIIKKGLWELGMPAFPDLTDKEIESIYTYLLSLKPSDRKPESETSSEKTEKTEKTEKAEKTETSAQQKVRKPLAVAALYWTKKPVTQPVIEAYKIAWELSELFAELPCFCNCSPLGHDSLLDCYITTHAMSCALCRSEARAAESLSKEGKPKALIAQEIVKKFWPKREYTQW